MLQPDNSFDTHWLDERYEFDSRARNQKVEQTCLEFFSKKDSITIVDIGSGTGSNCLYFLEKMPPNQHWIFVEHDERLSKYALERIQKIATENNYSASLFPNLSTSSGGKIILEKENRKIEVEYFTDSFLGLGDKIDLSKVDLVSAGAVFDLLPFKEFVEFATVILENGIALLTTMNYAEMTFTPEEASDVLFIGKYEEHMVRPQELGKSMGKECSRMMVKFFRQHEKEVTYGPSVWNLEGKESEEMHRHLFGFMKSAVGEMLEEEDEKKLFSKWLYLKKEIAAEGKLKTSIQHYDIFVADKK